jgi:hypothetical protein
MYVCTVNSTSDFTLLTFYRSYFKGINANILFTYFGKHVKPSRLQLQSLAPTNPHWALFPYV